ncbi:MAG: hypothetical protein KC619_22780 [Myxococcales bacterium]|nr:hypothetical protein [Myxococcales bacterium]
MHYDAKGNELRFDHLTGHALGRCAFMGYRAPAQTVPRPAFMESWSLQPSAELDDGAREIRVDLGLRGFVTGLWMAPSGTLYAVDFDGRLYVQRPDGAARSWETQDWGRLVELHGIAGLAEDCAFVWGRDANQPRMWELFEGRFVNMTAPPSRLTCVAGAHAQCVYAAGPAGYLARWDGAEWHRIAIRSMRPATALHVVDEDEIWLTTDMGKLFEGSRHGWGLRAEMEVPLCGVRRWRGELFVAAKDHGLWKLDGRSSRFAPVDLMLPAIGFAGDEDTLLVLTEDYLAVTHDGVEFEVVAREALAQLRGYEPPLWSDE